MIKRKAPPLRVIKLKRSLKPLPNLNLEPMKFKTTDIVFPQAPARAFIETTDKLRSRATLRRVLSEKYEEVFAVWPPSELELEAVRARVIYRLQIEGYRLAALPVPPKLLSNYNAIMRASDADPFEGLDADTASIARRMAIQKGDVSMAKPKAKLKVKVKPTTTHRVKIYDEYSMCAVIRFLAGKKITPVQIEAVLTLLGIKISPSVHSTVTTVTSDVRSGRIKAFDVSAEHSSKLLKLVPKLTGPIGKKPVAKATPKATPKAVKKTLTPKVVSA